MKIYKKNMQAVVKLQKKKVYDKTKDTIMILNVNKIV